MNKINPKMAEDSIIKPFIHFNKGQCPRCSGPIVVLESEISSMIISEHGLHISYDTEMYKIKCYCSACNRVWPILKHGMEFEVVSNLKMKQAFDRVFNRSYEEEEVEPAEYNPFGKKE